MLGSRPHLPAPFFAPHPFLMLPKARPAFYFTRKAAVCPFQPQNRCQWPTRLWRPAQSLERRRGTAVKQLGIFRRADRRGQSFRSKKRPPSQGGLEKNQSFINCSFVLVRFYGCTTSCLPVVETRPEVFFSAISLTLACTFSVAVMSMVDAA